MAKKKKSGKKVVMIIIFAVLICLIVLLVVFADKSRNLKENPAGTVGNTGGNINNEGLFCQDGDIVYFSNPNDNFNVYSMNLDGSNQKKVLHMPAKYLNVAGGYLYYNQVDTDTKMVYGFAAETHGIYRFKLGSRNETKGYDRTVAGQVIVVDNDIYYQHYDDTDGMTLYRCTINGEDKAEVLKKIVNLSCVMGGNIYYPDQDNAFYLNVLDSTTLNNSLFLNERMYQPVYSDGYIYYIAIGDDYPLCRFDISSRTVEKLTEDRVDAFNVLGGVIFYQRNDKDSPALIRMAINGSSPTVIAMGNYQNINMTSTYTYFHAYKDPSNLFRVSTTGSPRPEAFVPEVIEESSKMPSFFKKKE